MNFIWNVFLGFSNGMCYRRIFVSKFFFAADWRNKIKSGKKRWTNGTLRQSWFLIQFWSSKKNRFFGGKRALKPIMSFEGYADSALLRLPFHVHFNFKSLCSYPYLTLSPISFQIQFKLKNSKSPGFLVLLQTPQIEKWTKIHWTIIIINDVVVRHKNKNPTTT